VGAGAGVGVVPYSGLINGNATSDTLALIPLWELQDTVTTLDEIGAIVLGVAIALALLLLLVPGRYALALPAVVLVLYAVALWPIEDEPHGGIHHASVGALYGGASKPTHDWIDAKLGHHARVAVLFDSLTMDKFTVWTNEFFNRSVRTVYDLAGPTPGDLPETQVHVDQVTGRIAGVREPYILTSRTVQLDEPAVLTDAVKGLSVYRVVRPLGVTSVTTGIYPDTWAEAGATYTRFKCRTGQTLLALVGADAQLIRTDSTVIAATGGHSQQFTVPYDKTATLHIPLRATAGRCVVHFRIAPVAQPATVEPGSTDTRILGMRFLDFTVR
jgi:hypothetical protein